MGCFRIARTHPLYHNPKSHAMRFCITPARALPILLLIIAALALADAAVR